MRGLVVMALCLSIGAQWLVLQSIAWATMIVQYSHHTSLVEALAESFDGDHPCDLCKGITAAKHSEKKTGATQALAKKADLICVTRSFVPLRKYCDLHFVTLAANPPLRFDSPPSPPPRRQLV